MRRTHTIFTLFCAPLTQVYCKLVEFTGQHDGQFSHFTSSTGSFCPWHRDTLSLTPEWAATERSPLELVSGSCIGNLSQEVCIYSNPSFGNGQGIAFLTSPKRAARLAQSTSLTDPMIHSQTERLNLATNPKWEVRAIPGKGMGVIATGHLGLGDHVMSATPAVVQDNRIFELPEDQATTLRLQAVERLPPVLRTAFLKLTTHDDVASLSERVEKILDVNSFELDMVGDVQDDEGEKSWLAVFPDSEYFRIRVRTIAWTDQDSIVSRLNHACRPNAQYYFDPRTMTQHVYAVRDIYPGEEITVSYIKNRHQIKASDERILQIQKLIKEFQDRSRHSKATPQAAELLVSLYHQEKLWYALYEAYTMAALEYSFVGEARLATKYARLAIEHGIASAGPEDENVEMMGKLARDPRNHWSWMYRIDIQSSSL
ncbi:hypothetical protein PG985_004379 [Apiospora marii]|uniref:SET domain-containing protein n=1 Tax=Apiospora marii TaxID=335849 RepID=A0ABR1SAE5_9PEZI